MKGVRDMDRGVNELWLKDCISRERHTGKHQRERRRGSKIIRMIERKALVDGHMDEWGDKQTESIDVTNAIRKTFQQRVYYILRENFHILAFHTSQNARVMILIQK